MFFSLNKSIRNHCHCTLCTKSFTQDGDLQKHIRVHLVKTFLHCVHNILPGGNLKKHIRTNSGETVISALFVKNPSHRVQI